MYGALFCSLQYACTRKKINGVRSTWKAVKKNESVCGHGPHTIQFSTAHFYYTLNYIYISSVRSRLELIVGRPPTQYTISSFVVAIIIIIFFN